MRILELFAGYGSQALALEKLGIDFTSDISEIDKYAIQAYNQLHGETHNWGDITKIDETKLPYYDLITYSSPCQDFSVAGLQKGGDFGSGTRSSLLWECERIIRAVKPKYLLMENVKNLVGEKHRHNFVKWLNTLEMMGYQNFWKVLNAKDYGVPQNRERVFVVSILGCGQYLFPNPIKLEKRLKDVLEPQVDERYYLSQDNVDKLVLNMKVSEQHGINLSNQGTNFDKLTDVSNTLMARDYKGLGNQSMTAVIEPLVCASRGRENGQELEVQSEPITNTITSVQKDNYIAEPNVLTPKRTEYGKQIRKEYESGTVKESRHNMTELEPRKDGISNTLTSVQKDNMLLEPINPLKGLTQYGWHFEQEVFDTDGLSRAVKAGGGSGNIPKIIEEPFNLYPNSGNPQAGRVYNTEGISPNMDTCSGGNRMPKITEQYSIRKLTPRECWRLMGVKDEQFDKLHDLSNTQLYKMAGNGIVVDVLMGIFKNLFQSDEGTKGQLTLL